MVALQNNYERFDGGTGDGPTDRPTVSHTVRFSYKDVRTHLERPHSGIIRLKNYRKLIG